MTIYKQGERSRQRILNQNGQQKWQNIVKDNAAFKGKQKRQLLQGAKIQKGKCKKKNFIYIKYVLQLRAAQENKKLQVWKLKRWKG